jgi:hypothetical protein
MLFSRHKKTRSMAGCDVFDFLQLLKRLVPTTDFSQLFVGDCYFKAFPRQINSACSFEDAWRFGINIQ